MYIFYSNENGWIENHCFGSETNFITLLYCVNILSPVLYNSFRYVPIKLDMVPCKTVIKGTRCAARVTIYIFVYILVFMYVIVVFTVY